MSVLGKHRCVKNSSPQYSFLTGRNCNAGVDAGVDGQAGHPLVDLSPADLAGAEPAFDALLHQSRVERWEAGGSLLRRELLWPLGMALLLAVDSPWRRASLFLEVGGNPWRRVGWLAEGSPWRTGLLYEVVAQLAEDNPWKKDVW